MKQKARCMQAIGTEYRCKTDQYTVGRVGVEPTQCLHRGILSPLRLPIPPPPQVRTILLVPGERSREIVN